MLFSHELREIIRRLLRRERELDAILVRGKKKPSEAEDDQVERKASKKGDTEV